MEVFFPVQKLKRKRIAQALCSMHLMFEQHWLINSSLHKEHAQKNKEIQPVAQ